MSIPADLVVLAPWKALDSSLDRAALLCIELTATLPMSHVLSGLKVTAVAARVDRDEVFFEVAGSEMPLAVVHMTRQKEMDLRWPNITLFSSWEQWVQEDIQPAHEDYAL
jgi:hypothetical protein